MNTFGLNKFLQLVGICECPRETTQPDANNMFKKAQHLKSLFTWPDNQDEIQKPHINTQHSCSNVIILSHLCKTHLSVPPDTIIFSNLSVCFFTKNFNLRAVSYNFQLFP